MKVGPSPKPAKKSRKTPHKNADVREFLSYLGAERALAKSAIERAGDSRKGLEDLFWALVSSKEFLYNH